MFWGIDRPEWIQLWSGGLGAIPAAVIAALVAMWVLRRSNEHQRAIAAKAAKEQDRLAGVQLEEQKRLSALQLEVQREEAAQVRRNEIMADLLASANSFRLACVKGPDAVDEQYAHFSAQANRWELEIRDPKNRLEFVAWGNVLWAPARYLSIFPNASAEIRKAWQDFLTELEVAISSAGVVIVSASDADRSEFLDFVRARRREFKARWDDDLSERISGRV